MEEILYMSNFVSALGLQPCIAIHSVQGIKPADHYMLLSYVHMKAAFVYVRDCSAAPRQMPTTYIGWWRLEIAVKITEVCPVPWSLF